MRAAYFCSDDPRKSYHDMSVVGLPDDKELLHRIALNDAEAFDMLYNRYWHLLWTLAEKKTGHTSDAKDLVQELFIDIWNRRTQLMVQGSLKTYLVGAIYLKIFRYFRNKGFREEHYRQFESFLEQTGQHLEQVHTALQQAEQEVGRMTAIMEAVMAAMPEQMRKVFALKHFHQYSNGQIAEELQISVNTVKNHLKAGLHRFRKAGGEYPHFTWLVFLSMISSS